MLLELFEEPENQLYVLFEVLALDRGRNSNWLMQEPKSFSLGLHPENWMQWCNDHPVLFILFLHFFCSSQFTEEELHNWCLKPCRDTCSIARTDMQKKLQVSVCWSGLSCRNWWWSDSYRIWCLKQLNYIKSYLVILMKWGKIKRRGNKSQGPLLRL